VRIDFKVQRVGMLLAQIKSREIIKLRNKIGAIHLLDESFCRDNLVNEVFHDSFLPLPHEKNNEYQKCISHTYVCIDYGYVCDLHGLQKDTGRFYSANDYDERFVYMLFAEGPPMERSGGFGY
jgi:hypothetical protein